MLVRLLAVVEAVSFLGVVVPELAALVVLSVGTACELFECTRVAVRGLDGKGRATGATESDGLLRFASTLPADCECESEAGNIVVVSSWFGGEVEEGDPDLGTVIVSLARKRNLRFLNRTLMLQLDGRRATARI